MKKMLFARLVVAFLIQLPFSVHALPYSNLYVFGDSLSDIGNDSIVTGGVIPPPEYTDGTTHGRFTDGRNYIDYLSQGLGLTVTPSLAGGTDYAYGGARTGYRASASPFAASLLEQRDSYLASLGGGAADPNALYVVWGGSNNLSDILGRVMADPTYDPTSDLNATAADLGNVVASLAAAGARNILVPNVPDLGIIPAVTAISGGAPNPLVSNFVMNFNLGLAGLLNNIGSSFPAVDLMRLDVFGLLDQVYANPADYGLTNVTDTCYSGYVTPGGTTCSNPEQYLFWDLEHPTTATHRILAVNALRTVPEPATVALIALGLVVLGASKKVSGRPE